MAQFVFEAVDVKGKPVKGTIEARTSEEARSKIHGKNLFPTSIKSKDGSARPVTRAGQGRAKGTATRKITRSVTRPVTRPITRSATRPVTKAQTSAKKTVSKTLGSVSSKILTAFTQQLSTLIDAGLPIVRSLKILEGQLKPGPMKICVGQLAEAVEGGSSLSEAMAQHPKIFDKLFVNMVRAGEMGGVLDTILRRLSEFMDKSQRIKKKIAGAMVYPVVVISIAVSILAGIMIFVIPKFEEMFKEMNVPLPPITVMLITISTKMVTWAPGLVLLPIVGMIGFTMAMKNAAFAYTLDAIKMKVPVMGLIIRKSVVSRFCRTFGTLITSGVAILEALNIVKGAVGNRVLTRAIDNLHSSIREGESIAAPLGESGIFDDIVVNMIDVGEETGELDKMLVRIADNYDEEVDILVESLTSLLEPAMIVFMGLTVGTIVIALFMPLISLMQNIQ